MKILSDYRTSELVEELKKREGVEFMIVGPEGRCEVAIENEFNKYIYNARRKGPEVVFRIID